MGRYIILGNREEKKKYKEIIQTNNTNSKASTHVTKQNENEVDYTLIRC